MAENSMPAETGKGAKGNARTAHNTHAFLRAVPRGAWIFVPGFDACTRRYRKRFAAFAARAYAPGNGAQGCAAASPVAS